LWPASWSVVLTTAREVAVSAYVRAAQKSGERGERVALVVAVARGCLLHGGEGGVVDV